MLNSAFSPLNRLLLLALLIFAARDVNGSSTEAKWLLPFSEGERLYAKAEALKVGCETMKGKAIAFCDGANSGNSVERSSLLSSAITQYERALAANPSCWQCHHNIGSLLLLVNDTEAAADVAYLHFEASSQLTDDPIAQNRFAMATSARGDLARTLQLQVGAARMAQKLSRPLELLAALSNGLSLLVFQMDTALDVVAADGLLTIADNVSGILPSVAILRAQVLRGYVLWGYSPRGDKGDSTAEASSIMGSFRTSAAIAWLLLKFRDEGCAAMLNGDTAPLTEGHGAQDRVGGEGLSYKKAAGARPVLLPQSDLPFLKLTNPSQGSLHSKKNEGDFLSHLFLLQEQTPCGQASSAGKGRQESSSGSSRNSTTPLRDSYAVGSVGEHGSTDWESHVVDIHPILTKFVQYFALPRSTSSVQDEIEERCGREHETTGELNVRIISPSQDRSRRRQQCSALLQRASGLIKTAIPAIAVFWDAFLNETGALPSFPDEAFEGGRRQVQNIPTSSVQTSIEAILISISRSLRNACTFWLSYFDVPPSLLADLSKIMEGQEEDHGGGQQRMDSTREREGVTAPANSKKMLPTPHISYAAPGNGLIRPLPPKITIAYVSGDLREHIIGNLMSGIFQSHSRSRATVLAYQLQVAFAQADFQYNTSNPDLQGLGRILSEMLTVTDGGSRRLQGLRPRLVEEHLCRGTDNPTFHSNDPPLAPLPRAVTIACAADDYFPTATWLHEVGTPQHGALVRAHMKGRAVHVAVDLVGHTEGGIPSLWQLPPSSAASSLHSDGDDGLPRKTTPPSSFLVKLHYLSSPATLFSETDYDGTISDPIVSAPDLLTVPISATVQGRTVKQKLTATTSSAFDTIYRERLVLMPPSFLPAVAPTLPQLPPLSTAHLDDVNVNAPASVRRELPDSPLLRDSIVLSAAFNLGTLKFEPTLFEVWMNILSRTEFRVKLLIRIRAKPHDLLLRGLEAEAAARGIHPSRLLFMVEPLSREGLLELAQVVSLSLDTRIYGMHSAAMDALNHRIPVLALEGANPASRVSSSVAEGWKRLHAHPAVENKTGPPLHNQFGLKLEGKEALHALASYPSLLVVRSLKEYEDLAVKLAASPSLLQNLKASLSLPCTLLSGHKSDTCSCADAQNQETARNLDAAYAASLELKSLRSAAAMPLSEKTSGRRAHIVVAHQERASGLQ